MACLFRTSGQTFNLRVLYSQFELIKRSKKSKVWLWCLLLNSTRQTPKKVNGLGWGVIYMPLNISFIFLANWARLEACFLLLVLCPGVQRKDQDLLLRRCRIPRLWSDSPAATTPTTWEKCGTSTERWGIIVDGSYHYLGAGAAWFWTFGAGADWNSMIQGWGAG